MNVLSPADRRAFFQTERFVFSLIPSGSFLPGHIFFFFYGKYVPSSSKEKATMKKYLILWFFGLVGPGAAVAQLDQLQRAEILLTNKDIEKNFNVHSLKNNGILLVTESSVEGDFKNNKWVFVKYDTLLTLKWQQECLFSQRFQPIKSFDNDKDFFIFFKDKEGVKFLIFRVDIVSGESEKLEGTLPAHVDEINEFKVLGNMALIAGKINRRPVVVSYRFFDKKVQVLPDLYDSHQELTGININEEKNIADIVISENNRKRNKAGLLVKSYSYSGKRLQDINLQTTKDKTLQTGKLSHLSANEQFIIGNFAERKTQTSSGIYVAKITDDKQEFIRYYDYATLQNFFNFMKPKARKRMKDRITRRLQQGKSTNLHYRLLVHDVIPYNGEFIVLAEAYYLQYRSNMYGSYGGYGGYGMSPFMNQNYLYNPSYLYNNSGMYRNYNDRTFEGYRYTHAIVCGFNAQGELLWDNCFEMGNEILNKSLEEIVQVGMNPEGNLIMMYPYDEKLHTQIIKGNDVVAKKEKFDIRKVQEANSQQKVSDTDAFHLSHWYGSYFISWGMQDVHQRKEAPGKPSKRVFYLSKITYHPNAATRLDDKEK